MIVVIITFKSPIQHSKKGLLSLEFFGKIVHLNNIIVSWQNKIDTQSLAENGIFDRNNKSVSHEVSSVDDEEDKQKQNENIFVLLVHVTFFFFFLP